jgi:serine O-acetyltransferase
VIGEGSTIGGNVFLMHSVPPNSVVIYDDGRMIVRSKRDRGLDASVDFQI